MPRKKKSRKKPSTLKSRKRVTKRKPTKKAVPKRAVRKEVAWQAPEFPFRHKGIGWWVLFILILATLFTCAYFLASWWMIVFIAFTVLIILMHSFRHPRTILCKLDYKGMKIGARFFEWSELQSFWFIPQTSEPYVMLYLKTTHRMLPVISIEVSWKEIDIVFKFLVKKIPIEERGEPFFDKVGRFLKL